MQEFIQELLCQITINIHMSKQIILNVIVPIKMFQSTIISELIICSPKWICYRFSIILSLLTNFHRWQLWNVIGWARANKTIQFTCSYIAHCLYTGPTAFCFTHTLVHTTEIATFLLVSSAIVYYGGHNLISTCLSSHVAKYEVIDLSQQCIV